MVLSAGGLEGGRGCGRKPFPPTRRRCGCRVAWGCAAGGVAVEACTTKRPSLCMCAPVRMWAAGGASGCAVGAWGDGLDSNHLPWMFSGMRGGGVHCSSAKASVCQ